MKKTLVFVAAIAVLVGCDGGKTAQDKARQDSLAAVAKADSIAAAAGDQAHTAKNSLDIRGTYTGVVPCADCEGIGTTVVLLDSTYVRSTVYMGKEKVEPFEESGTYSWNADGNAITLNGVKDAPSQYLVGENTLIQLDMEGKRITGEHADKYILRK